MGEVGKAKLAVCKTHQSSSECKWLSQSFCNRNAVIESLLSDLPISLHYAREHVNKLFASWGQHIYKETIYVLLIVAFALKAEKKIRTGLTVSLKCS